MIRGSVHGSDSKPRVEVERHLSPILWFILGLECLTTGQNSLRGAKGQCPDCRGRLFLA